MHEHHHLSRWILAATLCLWMTACMAAKGNAGDTKVGELPGQGPYAQFIVKYRAGSAPAMDTVAVQERLQATAALSGLHAGGTASEPLRLAWLRRMSVDADIIKAGRPLDRTEAASLMRAFAADEDVEYIEVDAMMTIQPMRIN